MLLDEELILKWNTNNKRYYESKGYKFTSYGDEFICKIEDVLKGIRTRVNYSCDYCGKESTKEYYHYNENKEYVNKDACECCKYIKNKEVLKIKNEIKCKKKVIKCCNNMGLEVQPFVYQGEHTKIPYICKKHKKEGIQFSPYTSLTQGHGCYYCGREKTISSFQFTYEDAKSIIEKDSKNKLLSSTYTKCKDWNLSVSCEDCGNPYLVSLDYYQREHKTKCNNCNSSFGEKQISAYLGEVFIIFEREKEIFIDNREYPLRLDFYLPYNNMAIEFDGEQHYSPVNFDGYSIDRFQKEFEELQIRDRIKNEYCKKNNITLMRIPYWKRDDIKEVLDDYFINEVKEYIV